MTNSNQTALITGASAGLGYEFAHLFARDKYNLVLVARSGPKLAELADQLRREHGITVKTIPLDLGLPQASQTLFEETQRGGIHVDLLVNNAGYGMSGKFSEIPLAESYGQIQLNVTALTLLTRLYLGPMLERHSGRIMNVASTAAFQPGPLMAVYYATKAYVLSFSEALADELRNTGVSVTCFCPGATLTEFQKRAQTENSRLFKQLSPMDAKTVAEQGYRALLEGKTLAIAGLRNWLVAESVRFAPRKLVTAISRWVAEPVE
ncbi:MAG: SDR family oxidoreductase [Terriglobales bacterium]